MPSETSNGLSRRGEECAVENSLLVTGMRLASEQPYNATLRPNGVINLGTAENTLLVSEMATKMKKEFSPSVSALDLTYGDFTGEPAFRNALSALLSRSMGGVEVQPAGIVVQNGCGTVIESLAMVLCDPGDAFLIFTPYYGGFDTDFVKRANVKLIGITQTSASGYAVEFNVLEETYAKARAAGQNVRGLVIASPNNPLGRTYTAAELQGMLDFCHRHNLHLISDEIYLLSDYSREVGKPEAAVIPILTLRIPDPTRLHVIWGFSKDFGGSGLRVGLSYSRNPGVIAALQGLSYFSGVPRPMQSVLTRVLEDTAWIDNYIASNRRLLAHARQRLATSLERIGLPVLPSTAGMFVWVDFRHHLHRFGQKGTFEAERALWEKLLENGLYIALSAAFNSSEPGWFRIIIAAPDTILDLAAERIARALNVTPNKSQL